MISLEALVVDTPGLDRGELERWIAEGWVRPDRAPSGWMFREIDVARLSLIRELLLDLRLAEDAMPVVLRLLDQLYDARRALRVALLATSEAPAISLKGNDR